MWRTSRPGGHKLADVPADDSMRMEVKGFVVDAVVERMISGDDLDPTANLDAAARLADRIWGVSLVVDHERCSRVGPDTTISDSWTAQRRQSRRRRFWGSPRRRRGVLGGAVWPDGRQTPKWMFGQVLEFCVREDHAAGLRPELKWTSRPPRRRRRADHAGPSGRSLSTPRRTFRQLARRLSPCAHRRRVVTFGPGTEGSRLRWWKCRPSLAAGRRVA